MYVRRCAVERKLYCTYFSYRFFFISTQKYVRGYQQGCPWEKESEKCQNKSCQIALFSTKTATESLKHYIYCFCCDFQYCVNIRCTVNDYRHL